MFIGLLVLWVLAPIVGIIVLQARADALSLAPRTSVWVQAQQNNSTTDVPSGVQLVWSESGELYAPAWGGVVQSVSVAAGSDIRSGETIALIDGIERIAFNSDVPFATPLTFGLESSDVLMMTRMLRTLGSDVPEGDSFDAPVQEAVRLFAQGIGVQNPDGRSFDPAWIVYLPAPVLRVQEVSLAPAAPAPTAGQPIVITAPQLTSATLINADFVDQQQNADGSLPVGDGDMVIPTEGQSLLVNGLEVPIEPSVALLPLPSLSAVQSQVTPLTSTVRAVLRTPSDPTALVVPSSAVFTASSGGTCVNVGSEDDRRAVTVNIVSQANGQTIVRGDLTVTDRVEISPNERNRECG